MGAKPNLKVVKNKRESIRQSLLKQLEENGVRGAHYVDLVEDYMSMWDIKNELIADIEEKGVSVEYQNGPTQWGYKRNDSLQELTRTNAQMLKILHDLGLRAADIKGGGDDDGSFRL